MEPALIILWVSSLAANGTPFCGTLTIAHRGNSLIAPENTIAAISATAGQAHLVEFDVRQCATGELIVIHDGTVDRTTDGTGDVATMSLDQLKSLDAGSWFSTEFVDERIPTLAEALLSLPQDVRPMIHRYSGSASSYVTELETLGVQHEAIIQSFDWEFLAAVHSLDEEIRLGVLGTGALTNEELDDVRVIGGDIVAWKSDDVDATTIQLIHDAGFGLYVWTVNDPNDIETFIALDVDGIISDDPGSVFERSDPWYIGGDFDIDADVDLDDHRIFVDCLTGPGSRPSQEACKVFDFDCDGDLDLYDFAGVANAFGYNN